MKRVIHKWFWAWNFDKVEKWLNEMASIGLCLSSASFLRYEFEDCLPGEYNFRLEMLEYLPDHPESRQYISFIEDTGAEHVTSFMRWVYFKKKTADGPFDLFSDSTSKIRHLNRLLRLFGIIGALNLYWAVYNLYRVFFWYDSMYVLGFLNALFAILLGTGFYMIYKKKKELKKQQQIFE